MVAADVVSALSNYFALFNRTKFLFDKIRYYENVWDFLKLFFKDIFLKLLNLFFTFCLNFNFPRQWTATESYN